MYEVIMLTENCGSERVNRTVACKQQSLDRCMQIHKPERGDQILQRVEVFKCDIPKTISNKEIYIYIVYVCELCLWVNCVFVRVCVCDLEWM